MTNSWRGRKEPTASELLLVNWLLVLLRGIPVALVVFGGLLIHTFLRMFEFLFLGSRRSWTQYLTQIICRTSLILLGISLKIKGTPMADQGAVVANHSSWLDIFALNATQKIYFVAKSEVAGWPGIGWLARATGTVFIQRKTAQAHRHKSLFTNRLLAGHKLLFFPEGTSTDSLRVLPFKSSLFAAFFEENMPVNLFIQPVTVVYHAPSGTNPWFYGWWGEMSFGAHLVHTLASARQGWIELIFHQPRAIADQQNRKQLAKLLEADIRSSHLHHGKFDEVE